MPPSRGHVTKRKVASPEPDPDPVDDADTEGEEQEDDNEVSNPDASNGNEEGASSSTKKARVDIIAVYKEYTKTFKVETTRKKRKRRRRQKFGALPAATARMLSSTKSQVISSLIFSTSIVMSMTC